MLDRLFAERGAEIGVVIVVTGDYHGRSKLEALWKVGRQTSFPYLVYKVTVFAWATLARLVMRGRAFDVGDLAGRTLPGVPVLHVRHVGDPAVADAVHRSGATLLVSVSCPQRIPNEILTAPARGALNVHSSLLPAYAGLAPNFWVLAEGADSTGTTVHYMVERFDAGHVLVQEPVPIREGDTAFGLFVRLAVAGSHALVRAVAMALDGDPGRPQPTTGRSYRSHPVTAAYRSLRRRGHRLVRIRELAGALRRDPPGLAAPAGRGATAGDAGIVADPP